MYIQVDVTREDGPVTLEEPEDTKRFHVLARGSADMARLGRALEDAGVGTLADADHAWISVDAVRRLADGRVDDTWPGDFAAMLSFADTKGWLNATGDSIRAHCEWVGEPLD